MWGWSFRQSIKARKRKSDAMDLAKMKRFRSVLTLMMVLMALLACDYARAQTTNYPDEGLAYLACRAAWSGGQEKCRRSHPLVGMKPNSGTCPRSGSTDVGAFTAKVVCWYEQGPVGYTYSVETMSTSTFSSGCASRAATSDSLTPQTSLTCKDGCEVAKASGVLVVPTGKVCSVATGEPDSSKNNCCQSGAGD